jgi:arsenate reductase-like glutaredoxin family protein
LFENPDWAEKYNASKETIEEFIESNHKNYKETYKDKIEQTEDAVISLMNESGMNVI